jgi:hypothetical protein
MQSGAFKALPASLWRKIQLARTAELRPVHFLSILMQSSKNQLYKMK